MSNHKISNHKLTIDWPLLAKQKISLLHLMIHKNAPTIDQLEHLEGILSLLDVLQDQAERMGLWKFRNQEEGGEPNNATA